jgi:hypothetical protein
MNKILIIFKLSLFLLCPLTSFSKNLLDYPKAPICIDFMEALAKKNPEYFIEKRFPTEEQFFNRYPENTQSNTYEYYAKQYANMKSKFIESLNIALNSTDTNRIDWTKAEFLSESSNQFGNHSEITFLMRYDHSYYIVNLGNSYLINEKWVYFDNNVKITKYVEKIIEHEISKVSLAEEIGIKTSVPQSGFKAIFYDVTTKEIKFEQLIDDINVDLGNEDFRGYEEYSSDFHGIKPKNLGVYVVGYLSFSQNTTKDINIDWTHWSKIKVRVDNKILKGRLNKGFKFNKGKHLIEVKYENDLNPIIWARFFVKITAPVIVDYSMGELIEELNRILRNNTKIWYAGFYDSSNKVQKTSINLNYSLDPVILFISTHETLHIDINNIHAGNIAAIILSSTQPTTISFDDTREIIPVFNMIELQMFPLVTKMSPKIVKFGDNIFDENKVTMLLRSINNVTKGGKLNAYSVVHSTSELTVPDNFLTEESYINLETSINDAWANAKAQN